MLDGDFTPPSEGAQQHFCRRRKPREVGYKDYCIHFIHDILFKAWTKEETDQLFDLCERFVIIADRFPSSKTMEELKDRYYSVSRAIVNARASAPGDAAGHPLIKEPYVASQETERKRALSMLLSHTQQQERKDVEASEEPKVPAISDSGQLGADKANAADPVTPSGNSQFPNITNPVSEIAYVVSSLRMLRVYLRTYALDQMGQAASSSAGLQTIKRVEQTLQDLGTFI